MLKAVFLGLLVLAAAGPVAAHAIIVDSTPAPNANLPAGHLDVALRYNSRIDAARSKLLLRQGDTTRRLTPAIAATPDILRAGLDLAPGTYEIVWQVLATDGHVTRGRVPFTVDAATKPSAQAAAAK